MLVKPRADVETTGYLGQTDVNMVEKTYGNHNHNRMTKASGAIRPASFRVIKAEARAEPTR